MISRSIWLILSFVAAIPLHPAKVDAQHTTAAKTAAASETHLQFSNTILSRIKATEKALACRIGLAFKDKHHGLQVEYQAQERFHAASTMKVPVMVEVFRQADRGALSLDDKIVVNPVCRSFLEDTTFVCDAGEYLTARLNEQVSMRKLVEQMIVVSDNLATNLLISKCGYRKINSTMRSLGAHRGYVLRGVQDNPAFEAGLSNRMTAHDLNVLNEAIDRGTAASADACAEMRETLLAQEHDTMVPSKLPKEVRVAHKTGAITATRHDTGIVYAPFGTWYLTVLMDGLGDEEAGEEAIAKLSRDIYDARQLLAAELPSPPTE